MVTRKVPFSELKLSKEVILAEMGYRDQLPDEAVLSILDELFQQMEDNILAEYAFKIEEGAIINQSIQFGNLLLETGNTIAGLLEGSTRFAIFAATAGARFDTMMDQLKKENDLLKVYILDILGSCMAEQAGEIMKIDLKDTIKNLQHTNGFSPGYCGWKLSEQEKIFAILGENACHITLSEVYLMHPIKSISGIIGIGEKVNQKAYGCDFCELETCYKRKVKNKNTITVKQF